jgi:hypothetical protein
MRKVRLWGTLQQSMWTGHWVQKWEVQVGILVLLFNGYVLGIFVPWFPYLLSGKYHIGPV